MSELMKQEKLAEIVPIREEAITPMGILQMAVKQGAPIDTIERLVKLQQEMAEFDAKQAERAAKLEYDQAMQRAQGKMRRIGVNATNSQTRSKYATYSKLDDATRPIYTDEGFSLSFNSGDEPTPEMVRVICDVSHSSGHTRSYHIDMPADGKGAKGGDVMTKTHATGSALSYGRRYLLLMIFNLSVGDTDDDGNAASGNEGTVELGQFARVMELIEAADSLAMLQVTFSEGYKAAQKANDQAAMAQYITAKDKRKAELNANR